MAKGASPGGARDGILFFQAGDRDRGEKDCPARTDSQKFWLKSAEKSGIQPRIALRRALEEDAVVELFFEERTEQALLASLALLDFELAEQRLKGDVDFVPLVLQVAQGVIT